MLAFVHFIYSVDLFKDIKYSIIENITTEPQNIFTAPLPNSAQKIFRNNQQ